MNEMQELVGRTIKKILVNDYTITFYTDGDWRNHRISYRVTGDCCSESYFSDVIFNIGLENKLKSGEMNMKVVGVEEILLKEGEYRPLPSRQEVDKVYGYKILIENLEDGIPDAITIIFRNSSNGYYGGEMNITQKHLEECVNVIGNFASN